MAFISSLTIENWLTIIAILVTLFGVLVAIFIGYISIIQSALKQGDTTLWLAEKLDKKNSEIFETYRSIVKKIEIWLGNKFGASHKHRAFSVCLLMAFIYPLSFFIIGWLFGGSNEFAGVKALNDYPLFWQRLGAFSTFIFLIIFLYRFSSIFDELSKKLVDSTINLFKMDIKISDTIYELVGLIIFLVEDIATTGAQALLVAKAVEEAGAKVSSILYVVDREEGAREGIESKGYKFEALFTKSGLGVG